MPISRFHLATLTLLACCAATITAAQFPPPQPPPLPPPPKIQDPRQGGTTTSNDGVLARPVIAVGPVILLGPKYTVDFTVCNADIRGMYTTEVSPGQEASLYAGSPPEDFAYQNYSQDGATMNPPCATGGLLHKGAFKPTIGPLRGDRPCGGGSRTHTISVTVHRGESKTGTATYSVPSIGPCPPPPPDLPPPPSLPRPPKPPVPPSR